MRLTERVLRNLKEKRQRIINGNINSVPSPFKRFSDDFLGIEQGKFYLITSSTKGAKTQFASFTFIFNLILYAYNNPKKLRVKIFYYPLEETQEDILIRFMSFLLYVLSKRTIRVSTTDLKSIKNDKPLDEKILNILETEEYQSIFKFFEESVIFSTSSNPTGVYAECKKYAEDHGKTHYRKVIIKDEFTGKPKEVNAFDYYEQDDPDEYRIIFYDHVSLISTERNLTLKQSIDKLSEYCVILRNRYNFSPVIIQQQSFEGEGNEAIKLNKLRPTIANLSDSKYLSRDANVVLGLFSPFKFELRDYFGYNIMKLRDNVRFLEVLVNRGGSPGGIVALFFDGAVNYFEELPPPSEIGELTKIYSYLDKLRGIKNKSFFSFKLNKKYNG